MKRYATVTVVAVLALGALATGIAVAGDSPQQGCNPGEWVQVTSGDRGTFTVKRTLPEGYSAHSNDGVTIHSDGRVEAPAGTTVECIAATHLDMPTQVYEDTTAGT
jgi:hypothetical protein